MSPSSSSSSSESESSESSDESSSSSEDSSEDSSASAAGFFVGADGFGGAAGVAAFGCSAVVCLDDPAFVGAGVPLPFAVSTR